MLSINLLHFIYESNLFKKHIKKYALDADAFLQINLASYVDADKVFVKCYFDYGDLGNSKKDFRSVVEVLDENMFAFV